MKLPSPQFFLFLIFSILLPTRTSSAVGSDGRTERQVRLAYVDGDVRLSRGTGKAVDLNKSWEQAQVGESVEQGFALATRNGRTEVEFEDGSAVYLAENSLLLFRELSAPRERNLTRMTLPTGTATFSLKPVSGEDFFIQTPTDTLRLSPSETLYSRVDAYLDATAITAQADKGETLIRINDPNIQIAKGQTVFLQNGETIELPGVNGSCQPTRMSSLPRHIEPWLSPPCEPEGRQTQSPAVAWDNWVSNRVKKENSVMDAALRASGLSSPIPGLVDLYEHGSFFGCDEYGTCWEPTQPGPQMDGPMQSPPPSAQSPAPSTTPTFQTHTVEWVQTW
ncbi:MAG TPA: FecR domain-containing protein, partial [Bryobacteraceae bacterium]|nr:FecR domain-containing protein [Bryobacteraceae bacterium]